MSSNRLTLSASVGIIRAIIVVARLEVEKARNGQRVWFSYPLQMHLVMSRNEYKNLDRSDRVYVCYYIYSINFNAD